MCLAALTLAFFFHFQDWVFLTILIPVHFTRLLSVSREHYWRMEYGPGQLWFANPVTSSQLWVAEGCIIQTEYCVPSELRKDVSGAKLEPRPFNSDLCTVPGLEQVCLSRKGCVFISSARKKDYQEPD